MPFSCAPTVASPPPPPCSNHAHPTSGADGVMVDGGGSRYHRVGAGLGHMTGKAASSSSLEYTAVNTVEERSSRSGSRKHRRQVGVPLSLSPYIPQIYMYLYLHVYTHLTLD